MVIVTGRKGEAMMLIDIDDDRNCYCGECGEYERWNIDPDVIAEAEQNTTTWLGDFCPYRCEHCGHYSDSKTPFCAWCGRRASNYE